VSLTNVNALSARLLGSDFDFCIIIFFLRWIVLQKDQKERKSDFIEGKKKEKEERKNNYNKTLKTSINKT
jgi:hypothetical protein